MKRLRGYLPDLLAGLGILYLIQGFWRLGSAWGMIADGTVLIIAAALLALIGSDGK